MVKGGGVPDDGIRNERRSRFSVKENLGGGHITNGKPFWGVLRKPHDVSLEWQEMGW